MAHFPAPLPMAPSPLPPYALAPAPPPPWLEAVSAVELLQTPTYRIALAFFVFAALSVICEYIIEFARKLCEKTGSAVLVHVVDKMKDELMLVGFISLFLALLGPTLSKVCMPPATAVDAWLRTCPEEEHSGEHAEGPSSPAESPVVASSAHETAHPPPGTYSSSSPQVENAKFEGVVFCPVGQVPWISTEGLEQLHLFIFLMAVLHIFFCVATCALAYRKSQTIPPTYDFYNYMKRVMFKMFTQLVGMSWWLWLVATLLMFCTLQAAVAMYIFAIIAILLIIIIGMKMQTSLVRISLDSMGVSAFRDQAQQRKILGKHGHRTNSTTGVATLTGHQYLKLIFWFANPRLVLGAIHYVLFQLSFEVSYIIWTAATFHGTACTWLWLPAVIVRTIVCALVPFLLSYVTLPLFTLLNSLNPHNHKYILTPSLAKGLRNWLRISRATAE